MFLDRHDAAIQLIPRLAHLAKEDVVVLAIPRGAVPMARVIAEHYSWPLSVVLVKKIGHPFNPEYAIGAASLESVIIEPGNEDVTQEHISREVDRIRNVLRERQVRFTGGRPEPKLEGRTLVVIDDGIATGATLKASIALLRTKHPRKIVVAAPVAAASSVREIKELADECIVLHSSHDFMSVGQFYRDFSEVTDTDVERVIRGS